ncbi:MAG: helix-turn-helix transcriptional regulator [Ruminococcus sp.]|nr:helix-turn-helix transcriptional regulator [Ruminococcus sp.]
MSFGSNLKRLRKEKGIKQGELEKLIGVSSRHISKWERDIVTPSLYALIKLSRAFGCTLDELVFGKK